MEHRRCACGASLEDKRPNAKHCSQACANRAWRSRVDGKDRTPNTTCEQCGTTMAGKRWDARFCSKNCASLAHYHRTRPAREPRACRTCGADLTDAYGNREFCSLRCRNANRRLVAYGFTPESYVATLAAQGGCAICGGGVTPETAWRPDWDGWHIDHDHATGAVRGILCPSCNLMIGYAKDSPDVLTSAAEYLRRHAG